MNSPVYVGLKKYADTAKARFHMPGHAGIAFGSALDAVLPYDVTELSATDDLHAPAPDGFFNSLSEKFAAVSPGSKDVIISCAGSTSLIQAAVLSAARRSKAPFICERAVHFSVVNALALAGADAVWFDGKAESLRSLLCGCAPAAVVVTSPDYFGDLRDINGLADVCSANEVPLIVDAAHGAHLDWFERGRLSASARLGKGISLVVQSLHKTLPALTGAAIMKSCGDFSSDELYSSLRMTASSSPSFLIALSASECAAFMEREGESRLSALLGRVSAAKDKLRSFGYNIPGDENRDPFRLAVGVTFADPREAAEALCAEGVYCEFADSRAVVIIPSLLHGDAEFELMTRAFESFAKSNASKKIETVSSDQPRYTQREKVMSIRDAMTSQFEMLAPADAVGRVCAQPIYSYPPGIAEYVPGERIDGGILSLGIKSAAVVREKQS